MTVIFIDAKYIRIYSMAKRVIICGACIYDIMRVDTVMSDSSLNVFFFITCVQTRPNDIIIFIRCDGNDEVLQYYCYCAYEIMSVNR